MGWTFGVRFFSKMTSSIRVIGYGIYKSNNFIKLKNDSLKNITTFGLFIRNKL